MPNKPVIAQRRRALPKWDQALSFGVNAGDRKHNRFAIDPIRGRSSPRWRFTLKKRNACRSVAESRRKSLPSAMDLTHGPKELRKNCSDT
jgi:hypothetical protein